MTAPARLEIVSMYDCRHAVLNYAGAVWVLVQPATPAAVLWYGQAANIPMILLGKRCSSLVTDLSGNWELRQRVNTGLKLLKIMLVQNCCINKRD